MFTIKVLWVWVATFSASAKSLIVSVKRAKGLNVKGKNGKFSAVLRFVYNCHKYRNK